MPENTKDLIKRTPDLAHPPHQAYKYTPTFVANELRDMISILLADPAIMSKVQLFRERDYSSSRFYQWRAKYSESKLIHELNKKIDEILESRLIEAGLRGSRSVPMCIFLLKNHYGYSDRQEVQQNTNVSFKVTRGKVIDVGPRPKTTHSKPI